MPNKLNIQLSEPLDKQHSYFLLMEEITLSSVRSCVEWIFQTNFQEDRPDLLNIIITSPGGDLNASFALIEIGRAHV